MKFTAVGDFLIQTTFATPYPGFETLKEFIEQGDARFFNLETTLHTEGSCCGNQFSGGSYLRADPSVLSVAKAYGFNLTTANNNHAFDFGYDGFLSTLSHLQRSGFSFAGIGQDLLQASSPAYLDTENGRVALISVNTSFEACCMAGNPTDQYPGRPGINGLRTQQTIEVTAEQMEVLKEIAAQTNINLEDDIDRRDGYLPELPEGHFVFGEIALETAAAPNRTIRILQKDLDRVRRSIEIAKQNADTVIVSLHTHTCVGEQHEVPPHLAAFCRSCIDWGAVAVIGHGPHLIRGIEIYHSCPIFHSLGDFVLQLNSIPSAPADFYEKHGVDPKDGIEKLLSVRSDGGKRGLMYQPKMLETFIPYFEIKDGKLTLLELLPVSLGYGEPKETRGIPRPANDTSFMDRLIEISKPFGTDIRKTGNIYTVQV